MFDVDKSASRLPVSVITGFLGSGRTTLLNRLLRHPGMGDSAVIINEFGEVALDHLLVERIEGGSRRSFERLCLLHVAQRPGADAA
jgi:G3E family GTPase